MARQHAIHRHVGAGVRPPNAAARVREVHVLVAIGEQRAALHFGDARVLLVGEERQERVAGQVIARVDVLPGGRLHETAVSSGTAASA